MAESFVFSVLVEHEEPPAQQDGPVQPGHNTTQPGGHPVQSPYNTQYWDLTNPTDNTGSAPSTAQPPAYDSVYPPPAGYTANPPAGYPVNPPAGYGQPGKCTLRQGVQRTHGLHLGQLSHPLMQV